MGRHRAGLKTIRKRHLIKGNVDDVCVCVSPFVLVCTNRLLASPRGCRVFLSWEEQKEAGGGFSSSYSISLAVGIREKIKIVGG